MLVDSCRAHASWSIFSTEQLAFGSQILSCAAVLQLYHSEECARRMPSQGHVGATVLGAGLLMAGGAVPTAPVRHCLGSANGRLREDALGLHTLAVSLIHLLRFGHLRMAKQDGGAKPFGLTCIEWRF